MNIGNLYMTRVLKSYSTSKKVDVVKTKLHLSKHKNGNDYANNNKSELANIKKNKMPRLTVKHNNVEKLKLWRRNVLYKMHIAMWQPALDTIVKKRISFAMRCKKGAIKQECKKKLLLKRDMSNNTNKNINPNKNVYILKSNMIWQTAKIEIILPLGKETMMSIAMASSSSPCLSSPQALIPKTISHGH